MQPSEEKFIEREKKARNFVGTNLIRIEEKNVIEKIILNTASVYLWSAFLVKFRNRNLDN